MGGAFGQLHVGVEMGSPSTIPWTRLSNNGRSLATKAQLSRSKRRRSELLVDRGAHNADGARGSDRAETRCSYLRDIRDFDRSRSRCQTRLTVGSRVDPFASVTRCGEAAVVASPLDHLGLGQLRFRTRRARRQEVSASGC